VVDEAHRRNAAGCGCIFACGFIQIFLKELLAVALAALVLTYFVGI